MKELIKYAVVVPLAHDLQWKKDLQMSLHPLIKGAWAEFSEEFIERHILHSLRVVLAYHKDQLIGFCAVSQKRLNDRTVYYIEFSAISPQYQGSGLGAKLVFKALKSIIGVNLFKIISSPLEIMLITPNIRVLASMARYAEFLYPNPYLANSDTHSIPPADQETWQMARDLIALSDNPDRRLDREGLVLHDSYRDAPWQILKGEKIPWHRSAQINEFAKRYLRYESDEDREFIVRARFGLRSILRYFTGSRHKNQQSPIMIR